MWGKIRVSLLVLLLLGALAVSPFRVLKVTGHSMEPTLRHGETLLLDTFYWKLGGLRRNDIVVVRHGQEHWVKRLIGMPGDDLQIEQLPDGWITNLANLTVNSALRRDGGNLVLRKVQPGEIYVIGDNLNWSADSTNQEAGAFKMLHVIGVVRTFSLRRDFPFRGRPEEEGVG